AYKAKAIVAIDGSRLVREASFVQRREKKITRAIARKDATCTISTVCGRGEAEDEQLRAWIAKSRNGLAPVSPAQEGSALCSGDFFAVGDQSRTFAASDDLFVQSSKQVSRGRHFAGGASVQDAKHFVVERAIGSDERVGIDSAFTPQIGRSAAGFFHNDERGAQIPRHRG